jgi:predicted nucleic acid-binding protein
LKAIFVDTAGWTACADAADPGHAKACAARDAALESGQALVTTDFVADETSTLAFPSATVRVSVRAAP